MDRTMLSLSGNYLDEGCVGAAGGIRSPWAKLAKLREFVGVMCGGRKRVGEHGCGFQ